MRKNNISNYLYCLKRYENKIMLKICFNKNVVVVQYEHVPALHSQLLWTARHCYNALRARGTAGIHWWRNTPGAASRSRSRLNFIVPVGKFVLGIVHHCFLILHRVQQNKNTTTDTNTTRQTNILTPRTSPCSRC